MQELAGQLAVSEQRARQFAAFWLAEGQDYALEKLAGGLINETFLVRPAVQPAFVLQRISREVFPQPERVQLNFRRLLQHASTLDSPLRLPSLMPLMGAQTVDNDYVLEAHCALWRAQTLIDNAFTGGSLQSADQVGHAGWVLGHFHRLVADLPVTDLYDTLPGFHQAPVYLSALEAALQLHAGRSQLNELETLLTFVDQRKAGMSRLESAKEQGLVVDRVIHGDPKLDNMLFDQETQLPVALIDLDTVKPGLLLYDVADCLRSCCNRKGEHADPEAVSYDLDIAEIILTRYSEVMEDSISSAELDLMPAAIALLPLELGVRFLCDHIQGDRYFSVSFRGENRVRAAGQFALVRSIEQQSTRLRQLLASVFKGR